MRVERYAVTLLAVALAAAPARAEFYDSGGVVDVAGKHLTFAEVRNATTVTFTDTIILNELFVEDGGGSQVTVDGNSAIDVVNLLQNNQIEFPPTAQSSINIMRVTQANANISSGTFREVFVNGDGGTALILGGRFGKLSVANFVTVVIKGGGFVDEISNGSSEPNLEIHGTDFRLDGAPVPFGPLTAAGILTGTLQTGDPLDVQVYANPVAPIELIPASEPALSTILGSGLAYLAALAGWRMH